MSNRQLSSFDCVVPSLQRCKRHERITRLCNFTGWYARACRCSVKAEQLCNAPHAQQNVTAEPTAVLLLPWLRLSLQHASCRPCCHCLMTQTGLHS